MPTYSIGNLVRLKGAARIYQVAWVGFVLVRNEYGARLREPVYLLNTGHIECYYESDLEPAFGEYGGANS